MLKDLTAVTVTVTPLVGGTIASTASTVCTGSVPTAMTSGSSASGGSGSNYTYQWEVSTTSNSTGFSAISGATSETYTPVQAASSTTYYRRKVTNLGRDAYSNVLTFTVNALPTVTATASPVSVISGGQSTLTAGGASTYTWSPTSGLSNSGAGQSVVATVTAQTTFTVTGTDANGCVNTATVTVNVQPLLAGTISGTQDVCAGSDAVDHYILEFSQRGVRVEL